MQIAALTISPSLPLLKSPRQRNLAFRHGFISMRISRSSNYHSSLRNSVNQPPSMSWPARLWSLSSPSSEVRAASVPQSARKDTLEIHEKDLESEESLWNLYERWRSRYGVRRGPEETKERFKVFKEMVEYIYRANQMERSYKLGLNPFTDMTNEEFLIGRRGLLTEEELGRRIKTFKDL